MPEAKKVLISPNFGAGWTTWHHGDEAERNFMLTYAPLISAVEQGLPVDEALTRFENDFIEKFPEADVPYVSRWESSFCVVEVDRPFRVVEYDGSESVEFFDAANYIHPDTV